MKRGIKWLLMLSFLLWGSLIAIAESLWIWGYEDFKRGQNLSLQDLEFPFIVTDRYGKEIYRNFSKENREWVPLEEIPDTLIAATLMAEDKRFFSHPGVDILGIIRAAIINAISKKITQGASTITQQIARKVFLTDEKSYTRKLREMFIALGIESTHSKKEILEFYLNTVPYGPRINGVAVAAKVYFKKPVSELSESESLILSVLPQSPVKLLYSPQVKDWLGHCHEAFANCSPFKDPFYQPARIESILFAVAKNLQWTPEKTQKVWEDLQKYHLPKSQKWVQDDFQHFRFYIQDFLRTHQVYKKHHKGLIIKTSLDADLQKSIYHTLRKQAPFLQAQHWISNFAVLILENESRAPLVWIGSKNFWDLSIQGQVDMLLSRRQTGSTIKPFIYAAAIEQGFQPPTIFYDSVVSFRRENQIIRNSDGHFLGGIRMREALAHSRNVPAVKALLLGGGEHAVRAFLDRYFHFEINKHYKHHTFGWTLALGTAPIKISHLANGYATLGKSEYQKICPILEIKSFTGIPIKNPCNIRIKEKFNPVTAFFISDILSDAKARPPQWDKLVTPKVPMAIKTGTSSKRAHGILMPVDNYVVGYTPDITILLWGGNTNGEALKPGSVAILSLGSVWRILANQTLLKHPQLFTTFKPPVPLKRIHGEWATLDYTPPSYEKLTRFLRFTPEYGINPLFLLDHER